MYHESSGQTTFDSFNFAGVGGSPLIPLTKPETGQFFQRSGTLTVGVGGTGTVSISGSNADSVSHAGVEANCSWAGTGYTSIAGTVAAGANFSGSLTNVPPGGGLLTVRYTDATSVSNAVACGVGEVFGVLGQSNSPGGTATLYQYTGINGNTLSTFGYNNATQADNTTWADGTLDGPAWQRCGEILASVCRCPVATIHLVRGGHAIADFVPGAALNYYGQFTAVIAAAATNGIRAVLYWQGESDAQGGTSGASYAASLASIAAQIGTDLGVPFMPCALQALDTGTATQPHQDAINGAIRAAWTGSPNVVRGPDLNDIPTEPEDTLHLSTQAKDVAAGSKWAAAIRDKFFGPAAAGGFRRIGMEGGF